VPGVEFYWIEIRLWTSIDFCPKKKLIKVPEKTTDLSQVTDKLYHIMLYRVHLAWVVFELTTAVVICNIGRCKSNYLIITTTMAAQHLNLTHIYCNKNGVFRQIQIKCTSYPQTFFIKWIYFLLVASSIRCTWCSSVYGKNKPDLIQ
jgi:hypothetical protein